MQQQVTTGSSVYHNDYPKLFAAIIITILPIIAIFVAFQKKIVQYSLGGGIKE